MSLVLQPQASFTVVRQIPDWTDATTYYVQAVIRNAYTDVVIDTIQLISRGGQRYSKNWPVPADPSQQGFFISIVTSVYTDSGYTSKSSNYGDDENTYLIQERVLPARGDGGLDAFTLRKIFAEEVAKVTPTLDGVYGAIGALQREVNRIPKEAPDRWDDVLAAIATVKDAIEPFPTIPESDDGPVLEAIAASTKAILAKEVPPTNFEPVMTKLQAMCEDDDADQEEVLTAVKDLGAKVGIVIDSRAAENTATDVLIRRLLTTIATSVAQRESTPSTLDLTKLAG